MYSNFLLYCIMSFKYYKRWYTTWSKAFPQILKSKKSFFSLYISFLICHFILDFFCWACIMVKPWHLNMVVISILV